MSIKAKQVSGNVYHLSEEFTEPGEYFPKTVVSIRGDSSLEKKIYLWFSPSNNYPETVLKEISKGDTLQSIINESVNYCTGDGFSTNDQKLYEYVNKKTLNNKNRERFREIFRRSHKSFQKCGNVFVRLTTDSLGTFLNMEVVQFQKCRLGKGDDEGFVIINPDWSKRDKKLDLKLPLYPKFKEQDISIENGSKIRLKECIYHIKDEVEGFDHYGINEIMEASLVLNEKEYRRINWQSGQIKNGFKRDFLFVTDYPIRGKVKEANDKAFEKISGNKKVGGVETISGDGEDGKLVPVQAKFEFDFTKDDTEEKLFVLWAFPRTLIGLRSVTGAFSVEQIESDYEQYMLDVSKKQYFMLQKYTRLFDEILHFKTDDLTIINTPPAVILQNYMPHMNEDQKNIVIENVFKKYGINPVTQKTIQE